jgi:type VI secretion system protein ImpG
MTINDYYLQELTALRRLGGEFSQNNPGLSPYLAKEGQDPDVERMLEGFAFLTGRLRQQLDEELPEVSHNLAQLLWPNYVRPVPSYSIVAYEPLREAGTPQVVPRGTKVLSEPTPSGVQCTFRTCYETEVHPLELTRSGYSARGSKSQLELDFAMSCKGTLESCRLETLRLYLNGSRFAAKELYLYFLKYVEHIEVELLDFRGEVLQTVPLPKNAVTPVGFGPEERMLPYPETIFDGYITLQEYFAFEQKYLFVDIGGFDRVFGSDEALLVQSRRFRMRFHLAKPLASSQNLTAEHFALYCTPVVNLFEADAVPVRKSPLEEEYLLTASEYASGDSEVFLVESARGWVPSKNRYEDFRPFEAFDYGDEEEYYSVRVHLSEDGKRTHSYIRFASPDGVFEKGEHANATVSVRLLCTNRSLPSTLQLGQICIADPYSHMAHLKFKNITIPTGSYPPPIGGDFLWRMISNMSLNHLSLTSVKTLRAVLGTYDFLGAYDGNVKAKNALMLRGITAIAHEKAEMIYEGFPIRGLHTRLELDVSKFTGLGEAFLLCNILNEFFALYSNINAFHRLTVTTGDGDSFAWAPKTGQQPIA